MIEIKNLLDEIFTETAEINIGSLNKQMLKVSGINNFFENEHEYWAWKRWYKEGELNVGSREFGDFQTPKELAESVCRLLINKEINPTTIIEPTCGKGNFIHASLKYFKNLQKIYGIEIQKPYEMYFKRSLLENCYIENQKNNKVIVEVHHDDFFKHNIPQSLINGKENLLIIGNPPWVTVSELSSLNSKNMPQKSNFKGLNGIDAITGKSNFDLSEYIFIKLLDLLNRAKSGTIAMLCKNSIAKNIVHSIPKNHWNITSLELYNFNAQKEFGVATDASLFLIRVGEIGKSRATKCEVFNLNEPKKKIRTYGWIRHKFVSDIDHYENSYFIDNKCPLVWRSGIKHDCSRVMELKITKNELLENGFNEKVDVENELIYNLLKSSDLNTGAIINNTRKKVIVTQNRIGQDTLYIKNDYPKLWNYLVAHKDYLNKRKSSIYKGKPPFSIFGVGDYSFMPYKVAISGMYKKSNFSLVKPINKKPVMLDDTCYFLGFEKYTDAVFTFLILNSDLVQQFIHSLVFTDTKRPYTKDVLMRIDILRAARKLTFEQLLISAKRLEIIVKAICENDYLDYIQRLTYGRQGSLFDDLQ